MIPKVEPRYPHMIGGKKLHLNWDLNGFQKSKQPFLDHYVLSRGLRWMYLIWSIILIHSLVLKSFAFRCGSKNKHQKCIFIKKKGLDDMLKIG